LDAIGNGIAAAAATPPTAPPTTVLPTGSDPVSVSAADAMSARIAQIQACSGHAAQVVAAAGAMLRADAGAYADTDTANAHTLGATGSGATSTPTSRETPSAPSPAAATFPSPPPFAPTLSGRRIAELLHGGAGPASLSAAAADLTAHAAQLAHTDARLTSAVADMSGTWHSGAGHAANTRIRGLAAWHGGHAEHGRTAAKAAVAQAENFTQACMAIPHPDEFRTLERRLQAAATANAAPPAGRYNAVIARMQQQLAHLNQTAVTGYARYAAATDATPRPLRSPIEPLDWRPGRLHATRLFLGFDPAAPLDGNLPLGSDAVIAWCVPLPSGYRCTNLFPDRSVVVYPSPTDRTGVWW
jgi:hypothetical protein